MVGPLFKRAAEDLAKSRYAIALTGAGISTESGIPDFRGPNGVWTKNPEAERKAYQTYSEFLNSPEEYWGNRLSQPSILGDLHHRVPNPGHYALARLEEMGILKCVITQNIDGLHERAGHQRVLEYHGSIYKLRCPSCGSRFRLEEYNLEMLNEKGQLPPKCIKCAAPIKSDVVHFHEPIPSDVARESLEEAVKCDLMLICGTSAVVYPFANLPQVARQRETDRELATTSGISPAEEDKAITIIEVNNEPTALTTGNISDYLVQGMTAEILPKLVEYVELYWS